MKTTLVDSNIILDVATSDPTWAEWSAMALETAADESVVAINALIYAEVSIGYGRVEELELAIPSTTSSCRDRSVQRLDRHRGFRDWQCRRPGFDVATTTSADFSLRRLCGVALSGTRRDLPR